MGVALRGELARYLQSPDPDAASRVGTLAAARRQKLAVVAVFVLEPGRPFVRKFLQLRSIDTQLLTSTGKPDRIWRQPREPPLRESPRTISTFRSQRSLTEGAGMSQKGWF